MSLRRPVVPGAGCREGYRGDCGAWTAAFRARARFWREPGSGSLGLLIHRTTSALDLRAVSFGS